MTYRSILNREDDNDKYQSILPKYETPQREEKPLVFESLVQQLKTTPTQDFKIKPMDVVKEVPGVVGRGTLSLIDTFAPAITNFTKTTGGIFGEGLANATSKDVREQYKAGNLDILPYVSNTKQTDILKATFAAGLETAVYKFIPKAVTGSLATRGGIGALQGLGFAISEGIARDQSAEEIVKNAGIYSAFGGVMGTLAPYIVPILKADLKKLTPEVKNVFKSLYQEATGTPLSNTITQKGLQQAELPPSTQKLPPEEQAFVKEKVAKLRQEPPAQATPKVLPNESIKNKYITTIEKQLGETTNAYDNAVFSNKNISSNKLTVEITDPDQVKFWESKIQSGERPVVLTRTSGKTTKIADGNHKYQAYKNLGIEEVPTIDANIKTLKDSGLKGFLSEEQMKRFALAKGTPEAQPVKKPVAKEAPVEDALTQEAKKYKSADEFVSATLEKNSFTTTKPIMVYRGEGKGIGNNTLVSGKYFADSKEFASNFGTVTKSEIPAGTKIFDLDNIKTGSNIISRDALVNPEKLTNTLMDNGFTYTKNTNSRGVEYVELKRYARSATLKNNVDIFNSDYKNYAHLVDDFKTKKGFVNKVNKDADKAWKDAGYPSNKTGKMNAPVWIGDFYDAVKKGQKPGSYRTKEIYDDTLEQIWKQAQTAPVKAKPTTTTPKGFSKHYEQIKGNLGGIDDFVEYTPIKLKEQAKKAFNYIEKSPEDALRVAYGFQDAPKGINANAIRTSLVESLKSAGKMEQARAIAKRLSLEITKSAQDLNIAKLDLGSAGQRKIEAAIMNSRLEKIGRNIPEKTPGTKTPAKTRALNKIKADAKVASKEVLKKTTTAYKSADDLIKALTC